MSIGIYAPGETIYVGRRPGVQVSGGGVTFDFYADSVNGSDANAGTSQAEAFATFDALVAAAPVSGSRIGLAKGSHFREQLAAVATNITVASYGTGSRPIIDGSRVIPAISWTQDATYPNVYYADVTHEVATTPHATDENSSNTFHISMWEDEDLLTGTFGGADIAANRALVNATPGTFTAHLQGSTDADPRNGTGGTAYRYYVHLFDGGNPGSNGAVVTYAEQQGVAILASGGTYRGLEFRRTAGKDMVGMSASGSFCTEVSDCIYTDPAVHAAVIRPALLKDCVAYPRGDGRNLLCSGFGFNFYFGESEGVYTPAIVAQNNIADGFSTGIGSHGSGVILPVHDSVTLIGNSTPNCNTAINIALTVNGVTVNGHTALNCTQLIVSNQDDTTVNGASYLSTADTNCTALVLYSDLLVEDSSFVFVTSGSSHLFGNSRAFASGDAGDIVDLELNNVSNKGGTVPATNDRYMQVNLTGIDNVLGKLSDVANSRVLTSLTLTNSYLTERQRTLAEMVTAGNTLTSCLSPWQLESIQRTVVADDVAQNSTARNATAASGGITEITLSNSTIAAVNSVRIDNWDGAGADFDTYLTVQTDVSTLNGRAQISDATPGAFSAKTIYRLYYNKQFVFGKPLRQYHVNGTSNGPSYAMVDGAIELTGAQTSLLHSFAMASPAMVGTTGANSSLSTPQINAVTGVIDAGFKMRGGASLTVSAVLDYSGDDLVWAGDPDTTGIATPDASSPLYALGMGRQV